MHVAMRIAGRGAPNRIGCLLCPFHNDSTPSLHLVGTKGKEPGFRCFSCDANGGIVDFLVRLGVSTDKADAARLLEERLGTDQRVHRTNVQRSIVAQFTYVDEDGGTVGRVDRIEPGKDGRAKDFTQFRFENGQYIAGLAGRKLPLYQLDKVVTTANAGGTCFLAEGEGKARAFQTPISTKIKLARSSRQSQVVRLRSYSRTTLRILMPERSTMTPLTERSRDG